MYPAGAALKLSLLLLGAVKLCDTRCAVFRCRPAQRPSVFSLHLPCASVSAGRMFFSGYALHLRSVRGRPSAGGGAPLKMSVYYKFLAASPP